MTDPPEARRAPDEGGRWSVSVRLSHRIPSCEGETIGRDRVL
jgi:hypothetical protein